MPLAVLPHPFLLTFIISFTSTLAVTWLLIPRLRRSGFVGVDLNKVPATIPKDEMKRLKERGDPRLPVVPRSGGIAMIFGFSFGMLFSLSFYPYQNIVAILAALLSATLISTLGIVEDFLHVRQFYRVILPGVAALPLMALFAGQEYMSFPFIGTVHFGIWYSLLMVPIGIIACSNLINLLAGFNGLEAGTGLVVSLTLFAVAYARNLPEAALIAIALAASCAAFLVFNWYPAKVFPGNAATYLIGAVIAVVVIIGNMERVGFIALAPQIIEFFLKALGGFRAENFGRLDRNGRLAYEGPTQSLTHVLMKAFKPTEVQMTAMLLAIQAAFGLLAFSSIYW